MPAKLKLTYDLVAQIVELKRDGLCDADIIAAIGVHQATFYRWLKEGENAKTGVKRALYEEIKKAEAQYKRCLLTTIKSAAESRAQYWTAAWLLERKRRDDTLVRGSSYLDVIESHSEWLGEPFIQEAEYLRDTNELAWRWEYLGEITGTGGAVFDNVHEASLSESRIRGFERVRNGVDWGWFPDPWRFVRCAWEPSARRLLIFEEHSANKTMPVDTGKIVVDSLTFPDEHGGEPYFHDQIVFCDDTPDSKVQMNTWRRELGIRVHVARKARMRKLSYEWLAGLREIVIDPDRCPLTFTEFTLKEFQRDKEGNWIDDIPDGNDHSIDAVRYAMMDDVLRG